MGLLLFRELVAISTATNMNERSEVAEQMNAISYQHALSDAWSSNETTNFAELQCDLTWKPGFTGTSVEATPSDDHCDRLDGDNEQY